MVSELRQGEANLSKENVVNISQVVTVDKTELVERLGKLSNSKIDAIRQGLHLLLERA